MQWLMNVDHWTYSTWCSSDDYFLMLCCLKHTSCSSQPQWWRCQSSLCSWIVNSYFHFPYLMVGRYHFPCKTPLHGQFSWSEIDVERVIFMPWLPLKGFQGTAFHSGCCHNFFSSQIFADSCCWELLQGMAMVEKFTFTLPLSPHLCTLQFHAL